MTVAANKCRRLLGLNEKTIVLSLGLFSTSQEEVTEHDRQRRKCSYVSNSYPQWQPILV